MTLPANLTTIAVTGTYLDSQGNPLSGSLTFTPPPELVDINTAIMYSDPVTAALGAQGTFTVTLMATDNPTLAPAGWGWTVSENVRTPRTYTIYTPSSLGASVDISTLVPLPTLSGGTTTDTAISDISPGYAALAYGNTFTGDNVFSGPVTLDGTVTLGAPLPVSMGGTGNTAGAETLNITSVQTAAYTLNPGDWVPSNATSGSITHALPTAPASGTRVGGKLIATSGSNTVAFQCGGSDVVNAAGGATSIVLTLPGQGFIAQYLGGIWYVQGGDYPLTQLDARYLRMASLPLPVSDGGTGGASLSAAGILQSSNNLSDVQSPATARASLSAAKSGANSDITSLTGLSTPLSLGQGGTGGTTQVWVDLSTAQNIAGVKTFTTAPVIPGGPAITLDWINVKTKGVTLNFAELASCAITASSSALTATGASFTANDVGKSIFIPGAGASGGWLSTTISGYTSATQVTLSAAAATTVSAVEGYYGNDDTAALQNALDAVFAQGGGTCYMPVGACLVSGQISMPPLVTLVSEMRISLNQFTDPGPVTRIVASPAWAPSSSAGIVQIASKTPGGWGQNNYSCGLRNIMIDGSLNTNANLNGIAMTGPVYDVCLDGVFVYKVAHNGITASGQTESGISPTYPYHLRMHSVSVVDCGNVGFNVVNFTDSTYTLCLAFGNSSGAGWNIQNCSNSQWDCCRAEWNEYGFVFSGSSGSLTLSGCTTDQNSREGIYINGATGQPAQGGGIIWNGGKLHADANAGTSGHTYGLQITGSTVPVIIDGLNVESGQDVNNSSWYPASAVGVGASSNFTVTGCILQGITNTWVDNGGNTNYKRSGNIGMIGNPGAQMTIAVPNLPYPVSRVPQDQGFQAWNYDNLLCGAAATLTAGTGYWIGIEIREPILVTELELYIVSAGATLTSGENLAALFSSTGAQVGVTADQSTAWQSSGPRPMVLTGSTSFYNSSLSAYYLPAGSYGLLMFCNGTTLPTFSRAGYNSTAGVNDINSSAANFQFAVNGTGLTAMPSSVTLSSNAHTGAQQIWFGLN